MVLELERACYNEMERESMEYFYAAEKELQRQRERIRQLEMQIASLNGHLCHIWRPACDLNGGQPRTH